jgi:hypothetical protein
MSWGVLGAQLFHITSLHQSQDRIKDTHSQTRPLYYIRKILNINTVKSGTEEKVENFPYHSRITKKFARKTGVVLHSKIKKYVIKN